jgi:hypothetical protein
VNIAIPILMVAALFAFYWVLVELEVGRLGFATITFLLLALGIFAVSMHNKNIQRVVCVAGLELKGGAA